MRIDEFVEQLNIKQLESKDKLIKIVRKVSEIPWGEGRTVEEVLEKGVGTCTGKHLVLQACFDKMGIEYNPVVCTFKWGEQGIKFPTHLQSILDEGEWEHGHNFVQLKNDIDLDITWDSKLTEYGFSSLPANWSGSQSFIGLKKYIKRWDNADINTMKHQLIESLDDVARERRARFLKGFIEWIDSLHNKD